MPIEPTNSIQKLAWIRAAADALERGDTDQFDLAMLKLESAGVHISLTKTDPKTDGPTAPLTVSDILQRPSDWPTYAAMLYRLSSIFGWDTRN